MACHSRIPQSKVTADINLPGIALCRDCHREGGRAVSAAQGGCFECHSYHDWRDEKRTPGKLNLIQLRGIDPDIPETTPAATK